MIITLSGKPGSGKSTIANILAKELKMNKYSAGDYRRNLAIKRKISIDQLNKLGEKNDFTDKEADGWQINLGKTEDNFIIDGRLSYHFIPKSIKIFLDVNAKEGAKRILNENRSEEKFKDIKEAINKWVERMESDTKRYMKYYQINPFELDNYDYVLDTTNLKISEVHKKVLNFLSKSQNI